MATISQFRFPTDVRFGAGARSELAEYARVYKVTRPLLVTDSGLPPTEAFRLVDEQMNGIWPDGYGHFTGVDPNPTDLNVEDAWSAYAEGEHDGVVGLGGGSALDVAKALRLKAPFSDLPLMDIPLDRVPARLPPFCAIATTAGTGSEVGRSSVITVRKLGRKTVLGAPALVPDMALLDPELTVGLPPDLTAATGMDAFAHNIEALVAPIFHPMCDAIALKGIELVANYLDRAVQTPGDLEARGYMLIAAMMGAVAFQKDLGAVHSLAHPLSTLCHLQHGLANAICLVPVMKFNREVSAGHYARVANCFGINTFGMPDIEAADKAIQAVGELNGRIGIPGSLREVGVKEEQLELLAKEAIEDPCHQTNPRPCTEQDLLMLYREAYQQ
jgi:alcohol dehydrogenase class IV